MLLISSISIIILLGIIYLVKKYNDENKYIEGFSNFPNTVSRSLSTFNTYGALHKKEVDENSNFKYRSIDDNNEFNNAYSIDNKLLNSPVKSRNDELNGFWMNNTETNKMFMASYQLNDLLILSISNYEITSSSPYSSTTNNENISGTISGTGMSANSNCPLNTYAVVCQLNYYRNKFYLKNQMCNTLFKDYNNSTKLWGTYSEIKNNDGVITNKTITIYVNNTILNTFNIDTTTIYSRDLTSYFNLLQNNLNTPYPYIPNTVYGINATGDTISNKVTFMPINILSQYSGSVTQSSDTFSYNLCSLINNIAGSNNMSNVYIFYVSDFVNVLSLDYDFYGVNDRESSLILKKTSASDVISNVLKESLNKSPATTYKSFTNLNNLSAYSYMINNNKSNDENNINKYAENISSTIVTPVTNNPILWKLKASYRTTTCFVSLSAQKDGNNIMKYATFNADGSTNMDLNEDGVNQELIVEDLNIIKADTSNKYFVASGLFRTNNLLYLSPNVTNKNIQGNQTINLVSKPNPNGKWIIIGTNNANPSITDIKTYISNAYP